MPIVRMTDLDLHGKRVLIREDLNVPIKDGKVTSEQRILAALPTLALALDQGAAVMVMSHLGRPTEGHFTEDDSLKPVAERLSHHLGREVRLVRDWLSGDFEVKPGEIVLLENCRMNMGEGKDDDTLSKKYAELCDVFVMDAWRKAAAAEGLEFLADGNGDFAKAVDLTFDASGNGLGVRSKRYAMLVDDGVVRKLSVEEAPGKVEVSGGDALLRQL